MSYFTKAFFLGIGWIPVLCLIPSTRFWLVGHGGLMFLLQSVFLILTSVLLAALFRDWIHSAEDGFEHFVRAAVLPFVGCVIYLTFYGFWAASIDLTRTGNTNWGDGAALYFWGLYATLLGFPFVAAYGYVCQRFLTMGSSGTSGSLNSGEALPT